jgi:molecular chaperone DnaK (HSP70)
VRVPPHSLSRFFFLLLNREEFQGVFDERVDKIFQLVDSQIKQLQNTHARETINYLILSGGLGSSPYLKHRMRKRYEQDANTDLYNARDVKVLVAPEP